MRNESKPTTGGHPAGKAAPAVKPEGKGASGTTGEVGSQPREREKGEPMGEMKKEGKPETGARKNEGNRGAGY
jgi:hypothetical protein